MNGRLRHPAGAEAPRLYAAEELALRIERHIVSRRLPPGSRLGTKAEIRAHYEFAGGTVNEAVILLETRGMVEARPGPGGGLFVAAPAPRARLDLLLRELLVDWPPVADCLALRTALEPALYADAARHCDAADATELRAGLAAGDGRRLHRRIAEMTTNRLLKGVYLGTLNLLEEVDAYPSDPCALDRPDIAEAHEELVEALIEGGPDRLSRAVERHGCLVGGQEVVVGTAQGPYGGDRRQ